MDSAMTNAMLIAEKLPSEEYDWPHFSTQLISLFTGHAIPD